MSSRARRREREKFLTKLEKRNVAVLNLCTPEYHLGSLNLTGESKGRCYANILGSCSGPISKEHFISESILKHFGEMDASIFPWLKGRVEGKVTASQLVANCLCKYHNSFLSPLDSLAGKIFENFTILDVPKSPIIVIWGPSLQRWFLKLLIGLVASKTTSMNSEIEKSSEIPREWIEILFGIKEFPHNHGLYMTPILGDQIELGITFGFATLYLDTNLAGIKIRLGGIWFYLAMRSKEEAFKSDHPHYNNIIFHPNAINVNSTLDRVKFYWE